MENEILFFSTSPINKYTKLQAYDASEFSGEKYQAIGAHFNSQTYEEMRFKSGRYEQCVFTDCEFLTVGLSGVHFLSCNLENFKIIDSNMQFCDFCKSSLLSATANRSIISSSNLSQSMFHDTIIKNVNFISATISQAKFINISFENVIWKSCTLQDDLFDNILMKDISLVGCNLEYSEFKNIRFEKVILPLHQIPYAFGLLENLKIYPNEISIASMSSINTPINTEEYLSLLPDLMSYYTDMNEYFPAINIALFCEDYETAGNLIDVGIKYYIHMNDFRKIKSICKLIAEHQIYDKHFMTQFYFKLIEYYNMLADVSEYEKYQYSLHIDDIKKILTDFNNTLPIAHLYLKTNITSADIEKLGSFYQLIEECLGDYGINTEEYSLEVRHNSSPLSFWIILTQSNPANVLRAIGIFMSIVTANPTFFQSALNILGNTATISSFALQIAQAFNSNSKKTTSACADVAEQDIRYIEKKNQVLVSKKISIEISLPFFNFNYQSKKLREGEN